MRPGGFKTSVPRKEKVNVNLLSGEQICCEMNQLTLTNYRIRFNPTRQETGGEKRIISIMLEHVTSSRLCSISQPGLIVIGAILFSGGLLALAIAPKLGVVAGLAIGVGLFLGLIFFFTRHNELLIASPTSAIRCKIDKKSFADCEELLDKIENAINNRYLSRTFSSQAYRAS